MKNPSFFLPVGTFTRKKYNRILIAAVLAWVVTLIDGCADLFFAGAFLDETAVSAISLVEPVSSVVSFLCYLVSVGTAVMFSRESGAFHKDKAYRLVGQGIICSAAISAVLVIGMLVLQEPVMSFYGASEEITALARDYYVVEIFFAAIFPFYYLLYQLVDIDGDEVIMALACIAGALGNLATSFILVEDYGVKGLALGTIIGTVIGFLVYCLHFLRKTNSIRIKFQFKPKEIVDIIKISSTVSMTLLYVAVVDIVMNKFVILAFSDAYLPAYAVINFCLNLGAIFASCYDASSGFISVAYGENNPEGLRKIMRIAGRSSLILSALLFVVMQLLASGIADLYGITDPNIRSAAVNASRIIAFSCPVTAVYYLYCGYYPAVGKLRLGHLLSALYMLVAPAALAIPLGSLFGFDGLSWGFMLTSVVSVAVTALVIRLKYGKKALPLILEKSEGESISYDLRLTGENVSALCAEVSSELSRRHIPADIVNEVQLIIEESYLSIMEKNSGKNILSECDLLLSANTLQLITRDNGVIFDITDVNSEVRNLRGYVLARLMERNPDRAHVTTISFNRNSYIWQLSANPSGSDR